MSGTPPLPGLPPRSSPPLDAPDAHALIAAVIDYLRDDLMPRTVGADRWNLRIAANALTVAVREVSDGPAAVGAHRERLAELGYADDRELSEAIRNGDVDDRFGEVLDAVAAAVADSLAIANPGYRD